MTTPDLAALGPVRIIYTDGPLIVVDKPAGIVSAGPPRDGRLSAEAYLALAFGRQAFAVHQLDRDTSGLNCFVLKASAVALWAARLKAFEVKRYLAIAHGQLDPPDQLVSAPIGDRRDPATGKLFPGVVAADAPGARHAETHLLTRATSDAFTLIEARPHTGRTHQVRVHLAHVGAPLVGEKVHRTPPCTLHPRHALHASGLVFPPEDLPGSSPFAGLILEAPLPADLAALALRLGLPTALPTEGPSSKGSGAG